MVSYYYKIDLLKLQGNEKIALTPSCLWLMKQLHTSIKNHHDTIWLKVIAKMGPLYVPYIRIVHYFMFIVFVNYPLSMSTEHVQNNCESDVWRIPLKSCQDLRRAVQKSCQRTHFLLNHDRK